MFRGQDLISCLNGTMLAFRANGLLNRLHELLICANNVIFQTHKLIKACAQNLYPCKRYNNQRAWISNLHALYNISYAGDDNPRTPFINSFMG